MTTVTGFGQHAPLNHTVFGSTTVGGHGGGGVVDKGSRENDSRNDPKVGPSRNWTQFLGTVYDHVTVPEPPSIPIEVATETDEALPLVAVKTRAISQATETDLAQALAPLKARAIGFAAETDTAQALTVFVPGIFVAIGQAAETDAAQTLTAAKAKAVTQATETDAAQALTAAKALSIGQALETDTAQALAVGGAILQAISPALENDEAMALVAVLVSPPVVQPSAGGGSGGFGVTRRRRPDEYTDIQELIRRDDEDFLELIQIIATTVDKWAA